MRLNTLQRSHPQRAKRRIGRGGKRGKTSGRGTKGQLARAGRKLRPELRDIIKKIPKKRGYRFQTKSRPRVTVALAAIAAKFRAGGEVTPATLREQGLIGRQARPTTPIKVLGSAKLSGPLVVSGVHLSTAARQAILAAGGQVKN